MRAQEDILAALRDIILNRQRVIVLLRHKGKSEQASLAFRTYLEADGRQALLKSPKTNPEFVSLTNGAWVFFIACEELSVEDDVGQPDFVLWPTEGGEYALVKHREWKLARGKMDTPWRPIEVSDELPSTEGSMWDRLMGKDEIG